MDITDVYFEEVEEEEGATGESAGKGGRVGKASWQYSRGHLNTHQPLSRQPCSRVRRFNLKLMKLMMMPLLQQQWQQQHHVNNNQVTSAASILSTDNTLCGPLSQPCQVLLRRVPWKSPSVQ